MCLSNGYHVYQKQKHNIVKRNHVIAYRANSVIVIHRGFIFYLFALIIKLSDFKIGNICKLIEYLRQTDAET